MTQLAKESGCSVGNIYKRFSGKKGFLEVLIASADVDMMQVTTQQLSDAAQQATTLREAIDAIITTMVTTCREYRGLIRAIRLYRLKHYPNDTPNLAQTRKNIAKMEMDLLRTFLPPELDFDKNERAIRFAIQAVFSNVVQVAMLPVGFVEIDDEDFIDLSADMLAVSIDSIIARDRT